MQDASRYLVNTAAPRFPVTNYSKSAENIQKLIDNQSIRKSVRTGKWRQQPCHPTREG